MYCFTNVRCCDGISVQFNHIMWRKRNLCIWHANFPPILNQRLFVYPLYTLGMNPDFISELNGIKKKKKRKKKQFYDFTNIEGERQYSVAAAKLRSRCILRVMHVSSCIKSSHVIFFSWHYSEVHKMHMNKTCNTYVAYS